MVETIPSKHKAPGRGKQPKRFLDNNDVLELASLIGGEHEQRAKSKIDKRHQTTNTAVSAVRNPKASSSKTKIKEVKALLAAQKADLRKAKAKKRKQRAEVGQEQPDSLSSGGSAQLPSTKKRVSFA